MSNVDNGFEQPWGNSDNAPYVEGALTIQKADYVIAASTANVCDIALSLKDGHGNAVAKSVPLIIWLSDDAAGTGLSTTSASGTVQAKSASGADFGILTAKKALIVQTKIDGTYTLEITDTSKTGFYVCAQIPFTGFTAASRQLVTADYGA